MNGFRFASVSCCGFVKKLIIKPAISEGRDHRLVPAGVNRAQSGQLEKERQRLNPAKPFPPLVRMFSELRVSARMHRGLASAVRA